MPTKGTLTLTPTADVAVERRPIRGADSTWLIHVGAALWIAILSLARYAPFEYNALVQEDRFIEWWTVTLFAAAAVVRIRAAWPGVASLTCSLPLSASSLPVRSSAGAASARVYSTGFLLEHNTQQGSRYLR
jgi:hypothetical protein